MKIFGQENEADKSSPDDIAECDLKKCQIFPISHGRDRDKGQRAGLCGHDRKKDRPPWDFMAAEEIIGGGTLPARY